MNQKRTSTALSISLIAALALPIAGLAAEDAMKKAEARQLIEDTTPRAQYNTSRREAYAAYNEAQKECQQMSRAERNNCMKEARSNLQSDLADAKQLLGNATTSSGR